MGPTNKKHQSFRRSFNSIGPFHLKFVHARHDRTNEIDIEDRPDINQMECDRNGQEAKPIDSSHVWYCVVWIVVECRVNLRKVPRPRLFAYVSSGSFKGVARPLDGQNNM